MHISRFSRRCVAFWLGSALTLTAPTLALEIAGPSSSAATATTGSASALKHWVFFADKGLSTPQQFEAAMSNLEHTYLPRAIERRQLRRSAPGLFDQRDLPVNASYIAAIQSRGVAIHVQSRWLNAVSAYLSPDQVATIQALPFVTRVEPVRGGRRCEPADSLDVAGTYDEGGVAGGFYGMMQDQLDMIWLPGLHQEGYTGQGVIIGVLDTGFLREHTAFNHPTHPLQIVAEHDFIFNDDNTANDENDDWSQHRHGTWILGVMGAYQPNFLVGGAYDASFVLCKTEDVRSETPIEEDNYVAGLEFIEAHGGDMATSSLGYIDWYSQSDLNGATAVTTIAVNVATENGLYCCTAAGNSGHDGDPQTSHLIAPGDAPKVITCGAVWPTTEEAGFSSDGPTADGRVKPELLAQGVATRSVAVGDPNGYSELNGTSLSTPLVASVVACLIQAHPDWSIDRMRSQLMYTASDYVANGGPDPLFVRGYGIVNALGAHQLIDCNSNGVYDPLEIIQGDATDLNGNGVLDECDGLGDLNCDGTTNNFDIDAFVLALTSADDYQAAYPDCPRLRADINGDERVDNFDIDAFVRLLTNG